jgi:hypothetical protein
LIVPVREPSITELRNEFQVVLASRAFRQSRGLAKLLRYLCTKATLEGAQPITEYTIAVDVLGKPQDFKESKDASVRVEMHRLRRRLAEYYDQEGAGDSIRIVIPTGQYTPQFLICDHPSSPSASAPELASENRRAEPTAPVRDEPKPPPVPASPTARRARPAWRQPWVAAGLLVLAIPSAIALLHPGDPLDDFWRPVLSSPNPILLCFGNQAGGMRLSGGAISNNDVTLLEFHGLPSEMMLVPDAITLSRFTGLLQSKGKRYRVASQSEATFADLQNGPAVLIGLANNDWTERLMGKRRFTVEHRTPRRLIVRDAENPGRDDWAVDYAAPYISVTKDYALVVRVLDPKTEQMVVTAAGLSVFGTLAAGEFLTTPDEFRKIQGVAPRDWQQKNFELVLATDVIRGKSGHPNIVATHFW